ncbi:MAG: ribonuclease H family protein [Acidimicrobiales bacterium]
MSRDETTVYTDGACSGNPGPGGWAWAVPAGAFRSGTEARTTNQRMELHAVLDAVGYFPGPLEVVSDSTYVVNCFRDRWWEGWLRRGWTNSQKKPVANRDLWEPLVDAYRADPNRIRFRWVKGHGSDPMNDLVDRLAVEAARTQEGREGDGPPTNLGPADSPGPGATATDARVPAGHRIVVAGLRPPALGGYGETPMAVSVRKQLADILAAKSQLHPDLVVVSGLGLGAEQLGAEAAAELGVPYAAALAFPDQDATWPAPSKVHFSQLLQGAVTTVVLQGRPPTGRQAAGGALARRDAWLARNAAEAIVVWDHCDSVVGRQVRSLQDHLGEEEVWIIEP